VHVRPTWDPVYLNAKAEECAPMVKDNGARTVWYRGGLYTVIGYYLAAHAGERVLCYVLRQALPRIYESRRTATNGASDASRYRLQY
jgi:hypothetical protein